jgi:hypothetical protein
MTKTLPRWPARHSLFLAWVFLCVPVSALAWARFYPRHLRIKAMPGRARNDASRKTFAQKQVKLLCEKAKTEMSDTQCSSRRGIGVSP